MIGALAAADLRWVTAVSYGVMGVTLIGLAIRVWWMPLHKRAVLFEPYLTRSGVVLLLKAWPMVFVGGALLTVSGMARWAYYTRWNGHGGDEIASGLGLLEAIFSVWAAGSVAVVTVRAWRRG